MSRISAALLFVVASIARPAPSQAEPGGLSARVREVLEAHGDGVQAGIWLGGAEGAPSFAWRDDAAMPAASAIKTAYLVELFAAHAAGLDEALPGAATTLAGDGHAALAPFDAAARADARRDLGGASVRRAGEAMIRGRGVSNATYNVAANLVTASFGGPEALQGRIRARDPAFSGISVRRYMIADRTKPGDNEATPRALAAVLQRLAARKLPGVPPETVEAMRAVMLASEDPRRGRHFSKSGALDTDPLTRVRSGWVEKDGRATVYVVMLSQPGPGARPRAKAGEALEAAAAKLQDLLLDSGAGG